ncbi:MAG: histidine kinase [Chitinophagales bacterium]
MKKVYYILFLVLTVSVISCKKKEKEVFIINKSMRCKPAAKYLIRTDDERTDTLTYSLALKNIETSAQEIFIEIPIQQIEKIKIQQIEGNQILKNYTFDSKKLSQRIYYDRNILFPFSVNKNSANHILFRFHKEDIHNYFKPEMLIWKKDAKITRTQALELTRGVFYGILILYTFICFLITYLLNVRNYYYYLLYLIAGIVYLFVKNNLGYELLWPDYPAVDLFLKKIMLSIYLITSILFLRGFIKSRINLPTLQNILRYFILFGIVLIFVSLLVGLLSAPAQKTFIVIQNIFAIVCLSTVIITFIFVYFNINERSLVLFTLLYFISFSFFLFYPQPEFGSDIFGVYIGQIYMYSNAFIIATIICISTVYRVLQIIKENEKLKKEMSIINSYNNFSLIQGQQNERTRVGRELHDGIGIMMSAIKMKMSSLKVTDKKDEANLKNLTRDIDTICTNIRTFSHTLLPPTLKKFGVQIAVKDMLELFRQQQNIDLNYNFNIPENLSFVSQQLIYDLLKYFVDYFSETKPTQVSISVYVIPSINETQIRIQHTNIGTDLNNEHIKSVIAVIDLLNGKFQNNMINARNYRIHMEFPIIMD